MINPSSALSLFLVNTEISCERFVGFSISFFGDMYKGDVNVWKVLSELVYWKVNGYIKIRKDLYDVYINKSDVSSQPV